MGKHVNMSLPKRLVLLLCCCIPLLGQAAEEYGNDPRDPWEGFNRAVFEFNDVADRYVAAPVARTYKKVTPDLVDQGIENVFNNVGEVKNFANDLLQGKPGDALVDFSRFLINTTVGVLGIFDVAGKIGLERQSEDFGQTLGYWGAGSGPYLMLPFLGPSTPRHFTGFVTDGFALPSAWDEVESPEVYYARALQIVDRRADLIPAESFISGDSYVFVRNAFLQRREFLINDGKVVNDPFASDDDEDLMLDDF